MRRRPAALTALFAAAALAAAAHAATPRGAATPPAAGATPAATVAPTATLPPGLAGDPAAGLVWRLPSGWRTVPARGTAVIEPASRIAAATFDLRQSRLDASCQPTTARRELPADGAVVFVLEARDISPRSVASLPPRPARFRLPRQQNYECFGRSAIVHWRERGRALMAVALLGPRAGTARRRQADALLNSLQVARIAPAPPPAGWPERDSEAGDSLRVPPGWASGALAVPRRVPRPALLFWAANRPLTGLPRGSASRLGSGALPRELPAGAVVVWVVEQRRGAHPQSNTTLGPPTTHDGYSDRSRPLSARGWPFAVHVLAGPGGRAADVAKALVSAASLGVSGVGRQCSAAGREHRPERCVPRR